MGKLLRASALFAVMAGLVAATSVNTPAPAQVKKDDKKTAANVGTIEVWEAKDGWRFRVRIDDKSVAVSTVGHEKKEDVLKLIDAVKTTMAKGKVVEVKGEPPVKKKDKKDKQ